MKRGVQAIEMRDYDHNNIKIKTEIHESDFIKNFLQDEFLNLIQDENLKNSNLYIHNSYVYESREYIEFGLYITNTSDNDIVLKGLPLTIINGESKINQILNVDKEIEKGCTIFSELEIEKSLLKESYDLNSFNIIINNLNSLEKYKPIELELNIDPKLKKYISKREFNKFIKNLPIIKSDSIAINIFKKAYIEDGYFISLIFRNSSNRDITIGSLPIVITTSNDLIIYEGVMNFENNNCLIPSNKAVLKNVIIPFKDFPKFPNYNGIDFKILFKNL